MNEEQVKKDTEKLGWDMYNKECKEHKETRSKISELEKKIVFLSKRVENSELPIPKRVGILEETSYEIKVAVNALISEVQKINEILEDIKKDAVMFR